MRLADISEFFSDFGGGVRTYTHQKLEACAKAGVEATIIAPGPCDRREKRLGGEIIWVRSPVLPLDHRYHLFADMRPVHDLLDALAPDIVEGSSTWRGGWMAARWRGAAARALFLHQDPVAVYPQSLFSPAISAERIDRLFAWFWSYLRRLAAHFDATIAPSEYFQKRLSTFAIPSTLACPLGVDKTRFSSELRSESLRREMLSACGVEDARATLFISVGRHHPEKRLEMLIKAHRRFAATRAAGLYVIGDGPAWRSVRRAAARADGVFIAGIENDRRSLARRLASADALVHGGAAETFGLAVAEALCSGLPIISPDRGGAADLSHPAYGVTYRYGRADDLADAMRRLADRDRDAMSIAARAGANRIRTPDEHFAALLATYESLARDAPLRRAA
jgi:alpha-1,6-mannosyltransferase